MNYKKEIKKLQKEVKDLKLEMKNEMLKLRGIDPYKQRNAYDLNRRR